MGSVEVLSRTQRIIVDSPKSVRVVNAGPIGPAGQGVSTVVIDSILASIESLISGKADLTALNDLQEVLMIAIAEAKAEILGSASEAGDTLGELQTIIDSIETSSGPYTYSPPSPASVWTVNHNLGYYPSIDVIRDSSGTEWFGIPHHVDENTFTLSFFVAGQPVGFAGEVVYR